MTGKRFRVLRYLLAGLIVLLTAVPAFSQQCALCYTQAASAGQRMIEALRSGILILVLPPTLGSVGMIFLLHRRNQVQRAEYSGEPPREW